MKLLVLILSFILIFQDRISAQNESIKIEGSAQGSTYHITYFDVANRNFQEKIEKILQDFDNSVSTYIPNSIISRINSNEPNVKIDSILTFVGFQLIELFPKVFNQFINFYTDIHLDKL